MAKATHLGIYPPKITHYLLDPTSPNGASKEKFFKARGFDWDQPEELARALAQQAMDGWPGDV